MYFDDEYDVYDNPEYGMEVAEEGYQVAYREACVLESLGNFSMFIDDSTYYESAMEGFKDKAVEFGKDIWEKIKGMIAKIRQFFSNMMAWIFGPSFVCTLPAGVEKVKSWAISMASDIKGSIDDLKTMDNVSPAADITADLSGELDSIKKNIAETSKKLKEDLKKMRSEAGSPKEHPEKWTREGGKVKGVVKQAQSSLDEILKYVEEMAKRYKGMAKEDKAYKKASAKCMRAVNMVHQVANMMKGMIQIVSVSSSASKDERKAYRNYASEYGKAERLHNKQMREIQKKETERYGGKKGRREVEDAMDRQEAMLDNFTD